MSVASFNSIPDEGVHNVIKKFKKWYKFYKQHHFVAQDTLSLINYSQQPNPYKLCIQLVENIHFSPKSQRNARIIPCLKLFLSFFSKDRTKFFGRTYISSSALQLTQNPSGNLEFLEPITIYYLTRLDKTSNVSIALEIQILELGERQELFSSTPLGWVEFSAFTEAKTRVNLKKGSANILLNPKGSIVENIASTVAFELVTCPDLMKIRHLLPESTLCGFDEFLPGLQGRHLPNAVEPNIQVLLEPSYRFFFSGIQILIPENTEKEIMKIAQKYKEKKYEKSGEGVGFNDLAIQERRLVVIFHNGWTAVNSRGYSNYSLLIEAGHKDMGVNKNNEPMVYNALEYSGIMEVDNVFPDEYGIFVFQLEYLVTFTSPIRGKDSLKLVLGWLPFIFTEDHFQQGQVSIQEELMKGPGKNFNNERIAELNSLNDEMQIILLGNLGVSEKIAQAGTFNKFSEPAKFQSSAKSFSQFAGTREVPHHSRIDRFQQEEELKQRIVLNERQKDLEQMRFLQEERLQKELEEIQYMKERLLNDNEKQSREVYLRETEYKQQLASLREAQLSKELKTQKDMDELKSLIQTLVKQRDVDQEKLSEIKHQTEHPVLFDKIDQEKWKIIDGIISVPKKTVAQEDRAFLLQPEFEGRDLSRADKAHLIQSGIRGLLDDALDIDAKTFENMERNLKIEQDDPLKASVILVQFLGFRPKLVNFTKKTDENIGSLFNEDYYVPEKMYFTMNFFDYSLFKTDMVTFEGVYEKGISNMLSTNQALVFVKESYLKGGIEGKEIAYKFDVDPSLTRSPDYYIEYLKYLYRKTLNIDIWDADTLMLFGTIKIPLKNLLRQGRQVATIAKEFEVIDPNLSRIKGSIQLLLKNIGKSPQISEIGENKLGFISNKDGRIKKKVKSKKPLQVPKGHHRMLETAKYLNEMQNDQNKRLEERIKRHKMNFLEQELAKENRTVEILNKQDAETRQKLVTEITYYRDEKKQQYAKSVLTEYLSKERVLVSSFGKVEIIDFEFSNKEAHEQAFSITIDDPHAKSLDSSEISLVKNAAEWKFWVEKKGFNKPSEWNMVSEENVLVLGPKERVTLLFKFLSFRNLSEMQQYDHEEDDTKQLTAARNINVYFNVLKGKVYDGFILKIEPHNSVVDHVFRYYERDNRQVSLVLPALYYFSQAPITKPLLHITYPKTLVEWLNDREIMIQLKTAPVAKILSFNLLAYEDTYYSELLGNWEIHVHSFAGLDLNVKMGQLTTTSLSLPGDTPRICRLYSSHPLTVYFPSPFDKNFALAPGKVNNVEINVKSFMETTQKVQINCVDINSKELVYGWVLRIDTGAPNVTKIFDMNCKVGVESIQKFVYNNKSNSYAIFSFTSSHPDIVQLIESKIAINGGERETIRIKVPARHQPGQATVHIFAVDQDEKIFDTLQFKIKFSN